MNLITSFAPWYTRQSAMSLCRYLQTQGECFIDIVQARLVSRSLRM